MTRRVVTLYRVALVLSFLLMRPLAARAATQRDPSFLHGVGQVIAGLVFELPKTVLDATLSEPPVVGTLVGLLAGTANAVRTTVGGLVEMSQGFDPWGTKKHKY